MSNPPDESAHLANCRCQSCDGGIEFDASTLARGETRTIECPHCHLETMIFVPPSDGSFVSPSNKAAPCPQKAASPTMAIILWIITVVLFFIGLGALSSNSDSTLGVCALLLVLPFAIVAAIATGNYSTRKSHSKPQKQPIPQWICANCGTLITSFKIKTYCCNDCGSSSIIPLGTPRGEELRATYHGTVTAKERVEIGDEADRRMLPNLDPGASSGGLAVQLEKLAGLVRVGALTHDQWHRAKDLYLGQPKDKQESALSRIQQLHGLCQSGALSESEFNTVKWDILAKGMVKGMN